MKSLTPSLDELLNFPADPLSPGEIAGCIGFTRFTVSQAMKRGKIEHLALKGTRSDDPKLTHRRASKAAVVKWLWQNTTGGRDLMRLTLAKRWPVLLELLEADRPLFELSMPEPCEAAKKKIIPHPSAARARAAAQLTPSREVQTELRLLA